MAVADIVPFTVAVPDDVLDDLRARLARTRLPNQLTGVGWGEGTELRFLADLLDHWRDGFDWRAA